MSRALIPAQDGQRTTHRAGGPPPALGPLRARRGVRSIVALAVIVGSTLAGASAAQARSLPGWYTIQAKQPHDRAAPLYLGAVSSPSSPQPLQLFAASRDPFQQRRVQWQILEDPFETSVPPEGPAVLGYRFINRYSGGCLTLAGASRASARNGAIVGQRVYPDCRQYALHNGSVRVRFPNPQGSREGYQLITGTFDRQPGNSYSFPFCADVTGRQYRVGTPLQMWGCHQGWNQTFLIRSTAVR